MSGFDNIVDHNGHELLYTACGEALDLTELNASTQKTTEDVETRVELLKNDEFALEHHSRVGHFICDLATSA